MTRTSEANSTNMFRPNVTRSRGCTLMNPNRISDFSPQTSRTFSTLGIYTSDVLPTATPYFVFTPQLSYPSCHRNSVFLLAPVQFQELQFLKILDNSPIAPKPSCLMPIYSVRSTNSTAPTTPPSPKMLKARKVYWPRCAISTVAALASMMLVHTS